MNYKTTLFTLLLISTATSLIAMDLFPFFSSPTYIYDLWEACQTDSAETREATVEKVLALLEKGSCDIHAKNWQEQNLFAYY